MEGKTKPLPVIFETDMGKKRVELSYQGHVYVSQGFFENNGNYCRDDPYGFGVLCAADDR